VAAVVEAVAVAPVVRARLPRQQGHRVRRVLAGKLRRPAVASLRPVAPVRVRRAAAVEPVARQAVGADGAVAQHPWSPVRSLWIQPRV
jgi:hypothetical protein